MFTETAAAPARPKSTRRQKLLNILVPAVLSIIAAFITTEVGLRIFYQLIPLEVCASDYIIGNYYCQPYFVYDKPIRIGYRYKPGYHFEGLWDPASPYLASAADTTAPTGRSDAFWYVFETDEMGFPNHEYQWRDEYDIVITGDSFVVRTAPKSWIDILGEKTGQSILTLGASSWGTLNEREAIKMYGLDKHPKWIVLLYFEGNDLLNLAQYIERRDSGLSWKEYDFQRVPLTDRLLTPHLLRFFAHKLFPGNQEEPPHYRYPVTASTEAGPIQTVLKDVHLLSMSADYETLARSAEFAEVKAALLELNELAQAQGARFLLVYVPSKEHVLWSRIWDPTDVNNILERTVTVTLSEGDHGLLQWNPPYLSYDVFNENHRAQEQLLTDFSRDNGIEFLNLTPLFWQESIAHGELYHYADPHWNQAGNELTAEAIYDYMQGSGR